MLSAPVFVLGIHKSGTSLLRSLLDGAPGLAVLPREPHFFERVGLGVCYPLRPSAPSNSSELEFLERVGQALRREAKDANPYSDSPEYGGYSPDDFLRGWQRGPGAETLESYYERYVAGLWWTIAGAPLGSLRVVDKSTEYLEFAELLAGLFRDASFIHVVRNPYAVMVSYRAYRVKQGGRYPDLRVIGQALAYGAYWQFRNEATIPSYTVIRYEDITHQPGDMMRNITRAIRLSFNEILTVPTALGAPWAGNSTSDTHFSGVTDVRRNAWQREITSAEVRAVNAALPEVLWSRLGYERLPTPSRFETLRWHAGERRGDYVRNRLL